MYKKDEAISGFYRVCLNAGCVAGRGICASGQTAQGFPGGLASPLFGTVLALYASSQPAAPPSSSGALKLTSYSGAVARRNLFAPPALTLAQFTGVEQDEPLLIATMTNPPLAIQNLPNGEYTLRVKPYDEAGNRGTLQS